jgi:aspartyl-tRNA(Asn)/glutamyl-tRNA(Gln) amidotransferase subunit A
MAHGDGTDLASQTAAALASAYAAGRCTPRDALEAILARHDEANPSLNAVIFLDRDGAHAAADASAARWREGRQLSPLDGVPLTVKDNLLVAGMKATWGSRVYADFVPDADEAPVARLRAAGAVLLGKTNVPEFTLQGYTTNLLFGTTRNPLAPDRTPGGSTGGGAAAVAAGIGPIAIGTDGGGSTRRPAAYCGLYGLKPSLGQIARHGGFPQILSDFEVVGPIARSVDDLAAAFAIMRGYDPRDPRTAAADAHLPPAGRRIGFVPKVGDAPVDPEIVRAAEATACAFERLGFTVEEVEAPYDADELAALWTIVAEAGLAWHLAAIDGWRAVVGANAIKMAEAGAAWSTSDYVGALDGIMAMRVRSGDFFAKWNFMLSPTTAALAWPADEAYPPTIDGKPAGPRGHAVFSAFINLIGAAAVNLPVAKTEKAGGIGMQLAAPAGRDDELLAIAKRWETERPQL